MNITREIIEEMKVGNEMDLLVHKHVFGRSSKGEDIPKYSTNIENTEKVIDKYRNHFLVNFVTPENGFGYGWHCNISGVHVRGCRTIMEAVCKASLINAFEFQTESELYQAENKRANAISDGERANDLHDKISKLEEDRLYTKRQVRQIFGYIQN